MGRFIRRGLRLLALAAIAAIAMASPSAAQFVWGTYGGAPVRFTLIYGEGEFIFFFAECLPTLPGLVKANVAIEVGSNRVGPTNLYIDVDGRTSFGPAEIVDTFDYAGLIPYFTLAADDPLWGRLRDGNRVRFWVENGPSTEVSLAGSGAAISQFFSRCETLWAGAATAAVDPISPASPAAEKPTLAAPSSPGSTDAVTGERIPVLLGPASGFPEDGPLGAFLGRWVPSDIGPAPPASTLDFTLSSNPPLRLVSSDGWAADLDWGLEGDMSYATGIGVWSTGELAGQPFTVVAIVVGDELSLDLYLRAFGGIRSYAYRRAD